MSDASGVFDARERVLVIGVGRSGRASCRILRARGATVYATDEKSAEALEATIAELAAEGVPFVAPDALPTIFPQLTSAVLSPGIPLNRPLVAAIQMQANISVYSEIEVAYRICRAPIVAVTGTKGKTTTTALVGEMFRRGGRTTYVGGNIGNALIGETARAAAGDWVIAEVSSFQLELIRSFKPKISTILNISPDHLDRYHSMVEYAEAKFRIFANQVPGDTFVGNLVDPWVGPLADTDAVQRIRARALWFANRPLKMATLYVRGDRIVYAPPSGDPRPIEIMPVSEIPLVGHHNIDNVLAALLIGLAADVSPSALRAAVRDFRPLAHRLTEVAVLDGVLYIDDSKATNPSAVIAALDSFGERPIILIAGGKAKGTDFRALGEIARKRTKAVILIGEAAAEMAAAIGNRKTTRAGTLAEAVEIARRKAVAGDVVLLSPACASFDMFSSAEARGDSFAQAVMPAAATHGS